ncbi:MAG TPA: 50S ribosomal protein L14 [Methanocorpusculum sp.]|nr:50S ribosomal protein L14 [Methanocorpusculum sp.]
MRGLTAKIPRALQTGSKMVCADNTGARVVQIVSVFGYHGVKNRQPKMGIGDLATVSVKKGTPDMKRKLVKAVVVRQKKEFRRPNGLRISFEENAMILLNDNGDPRGTDIKGPVAREVAERFPKVGSLATIII